MTEEPGTVGPDDEQKRDPAKILDDFQHQAQRYMEARFGKDVWFRAPETFQNILERWIWCVAGGNVDFAEKQMATIEEMAAAARGGTGG